MKRVVMALIGVLVAAAVIVFFNQSANATPPKGHTPFTICHKPGTPAQKTLTVDLAAKIAHLAHGDTLGPCKPKPTTPVPTTEPTTEPTEEPTTAPTTQPTTAPTTEPSTTPTEEPTTEPTDEPSTEPTEEPTTEPTVEPTTEPTQEPTTAPTEDPVTEPTTAPTENTDPPATDSPMPDQEIGTAVSFEKKYSTEQPQNTAQKRTYGHLANTGSGTSRGPLWFAAGLLGVGLGLLAGFWRNSRRRTRA